MFIFAVSKLLFAVRMPPTHVGCFRIYAIVNVFRLRRVGCAETLPEVLRKEPRQHVAQPCRIRQR